MKKLFIYLILLVSYSTLLSSHVNNHIPLTQEEQNWLESHPVIKSHNDQDYIPFNFLADGDAKGYTVDILNLLAKKLGIKIEYIKGQSWSQYVDMLEKKEIDLIGNILVTDERKKFINFTKPILVHSTSIISRINYPVSKLNELNNKTVAVVKDWWHEEALKSEYPTIKILLVDTPLDAIKAVSNKQADATLNSGASAQYLWREHNIINLALTGDAKLLADKTPIEHIGIRKDWPLLQSAFNKALDSLTYEEKIKIKKRWFGPLLTNKEYIDLTLDEIEYLKKNHFNIYLNNWLPISIYDKKSNEFSGLSIDYWNKIKELIPINSTLNYTSAFLNSIEKLKNDKDGVMISLAYLDEKLEYGSFTKPYVSYPIGIATKDKENFILNLSELDGKKIAVGKNYSAHKLLKKHYPNIDFVTVKNTKEALELLANEKVYGAADILLTLKYYLQEYSYRNFKIVGTSDFKLDLRMMINKENEHLIPILNKAIDSITEYEKKDLQKKWMQTIKHVDKVNYTLVYILLIVFTMIVLFLLWRHKELSQYQNALEEKTKQLNDYVEISTDFIWEVDKNGIYTKVNGRVESILGYTPEEMIGKSLFEFMQKNKDEKISKIFSTLLINKQPIEDLQNNHIHKNGTIVLLLTNGMPIFKDNVFIGYRGTDKDITKDKQKDLLILEQSKLVAMGEMIANISHQWRQPLSVISTGATGMLVQKELNVLDDKNFEKTCNLINDNAQYLSKTIETFRNFIKDDKLVKEHPIEDEILQAISIVNTTLKNKYIQLKDEVDYTQRTIINVPDNELSQVIINIINNAKDILLERNIINGWIKLKLIREVDNVVITIEDNGKGIPDEVLPRIFEPYFTTKHKSQGTGLGLHMSYKIVTESLNGNISAKNTLDGAKLTIEIPL